MEKHETSLVLMLRKEKLEFVTKPASNAMCMIKILLGGGGGGRDGQWGGVAVEDA